MKERKKSPVRKNRLKALGKLLKTAWESGKKFFGGLFRRKKSEESISEETLQKLKEIQNSTLAQQQPGLNCPNCTFRIQVDMSVLLSGEPIVCNACGLKLTVEKEQSKACLTELKKVQGAIEKAELHKNESVY